MDWGIMLIYSIRYIPRGGWVPQFFHYSWTVSAHREPTPTRLVRKKIMRILYGLESKIATGLSLLCIAGTAFGATDPGVRGGPADAGPTLPGLTTIELNAFAIAEETFNALDSIHGDIPGEEDEGLGPTFNSNGCASCHAFPAVGGTSPRVNPQIAVATLHGARNTIPSFLSLNGPVREARFKRNPDGSPDGGVHSLFVITGRSDAPANFNLQQTNFAAQVAANNVSLRIPTPVFGAGLIESIPDSAIVANQNANAAVKAGLRISGRANRNENDGTISRFGWKAQNKSLMLFSGEAYNVEQGVTNDLFPDHREIGNQVLAEGLPESTVDLETGGIADIEQFTIFMRMLDAPRRRNPAGVSNASVAAGNTHFNNIGCVQCHTTSMRTATSKVAALSNKTVSLFSDLLVHNMGYRLADDIAQGQAGADEFRTAPLWGLGQRIFFLHDGRSTDLEETIRLHASEANGRYPASEANRVVENFINLRDDQKQDLFNFLRSL